ncbi:MAG: CHAT domain-containing protein [Alphaproteobacteria bacterium]|nr:CHAT domain-containing protein [Alphaproteobacteria bacterium]
MHGRRLTPHVPALAGAAIALCLVAAACPVSFAQSGTAVQGGPSADDLWSKRATLLPPIAEELEDAAEAEAERGNLDEAERIFANALSTREQIDGPDHFGVTITLGKLSVFYWRNARYADAERVVSRKIAIAGKTLGPDHIDLADDLESLALILSAQGRAGDAGPILERAIEIRRAQADPNAAAIARSLERLGDQQREAGNPSKAEETYRQALADLGDALDADPRRVASILNSLALTYQDREVYGEAERLHRRALAVTEDVSGPDSVDVAIQLNNLGVLNYRLGDFAEASALMSRSVAIMEGHVGRDHPDVATQLSNLALAYQRQDRLAEARRANARASSIFAERIRLGHMSRPEIDATRYVHLRRLGALLGAGPAPGAPDEIFETAQIAHASSAASAVSRLAERYALGGKADARWVRIWQDSRAELARIDRELAFLSGQARSAQDPARIEPLAARRNEAQAAADATNEMLKALYGDDYLARIRPAPLSLEQVRALLDPDEALLTFTVAQGAGPRGADIVYMVASGARETRAHRAVVPDLAGMVAELRRKLSPKTVGGRLGLLTFPTDTAHELYTSLLAPFADLLADSRHLLVVPDGPLTSLPFSILLTAPVAGPLADVARFSEMPWLIRKFAISTLPSVSALRALRLARADATPASQPFMGIGDPVLRDHPGNSGSTRSATIADWLDRGGESGTGPDISGLFRGNLADTRALRKLASLPETADELSTMARLLGADTGALLLRDRAVEENIRAERALVDHRILAFATHGLVAGEITGQGAEPALVLTPPAQASPGNDGLLTASEIAEMRLNAQWVILSACNTAGSDGTPGAEGLSGLASAFFYAGARSLFVSHWPVVSDATVGLTTRMLGAVAADPGIRASEAHRASMLAMMDDPDEPLFAHPLFWAPFVVVGDGGPLR